MELTEQEKRRIPITEIAKNIRKQLKVEFPKCKFSVTVDKYTGGQSLDVSLMSAPFDVIDLQDLLEKGESVPKMYFQVNQYTLSQDDRNCKNNGVTLTKEVYDVMKQVHTIINQYNYDNSDSQIDYFDVNFYESLGIGKWDKPFVVVK